MKVKICWFKNAHEHRLGWVKFGLMLLHHQKKIIFKEYPESKILSEQVDETVKNHVHRHTVLIKYVKNEIVKWILIDAEDSFFQICPLIKYVDVYFCCGYNHSFFRDNKFDQKLPWQTHSDVENYHALADTLIKNYQQYFFKVKPFIPIPPTMDFVPKKNFLQQKILNVKHKLFFKIHKSLSWQHEFNNYQKRYAKLLSLRTRQKLYDIVLLDSLWGWPNHRIALHQKLIKLAQSYKILSELRFNENEQTKNLDQKIFPIISNPVGTHYEDKLATSKLGVFTTGFHFGWRNIMTLSLMLGLPIYIDHLLLQPYFDMDEFTIYHNEQNFEDLTCILDNLNQKNIDIHYQTNTQVFDKYMSPEIVANYLIENL